MKKQTLLILIAVIALQACTTVSVKDSPKIVNIVNFIRQCEPRIDWITEEVLYETVVSQVEIMNQFQLKGTFLLQYDALIDSSYQALMKSLPADQYEIGAWWEIPQPLVENSGMEWRGRYPWDWHADVGFATGYTPEEREKLVDTYMKDFFGIFGFYPKSVGSWFIDAHTLNYLYEKYQIVASCNCKDQIGTDGYTLWGGYWNQGYYPSKLNAYMPAQNAENQIPVPIFRMLGSDPIYQYDNGLGTNVQRVVSLEPVYKLGGGNQEWCDWYFDAFVNGEAMAYGYVQTGQENSFTWQRMQKGFEIQWPILSRLLSEEKIEVKTLAETGEWFKAKYPVTPATSVTVLKDHRDEGRQTVWFNSRNYRANLLWEKGTLRFRDIHVFDETVASDYLTERGTSTSCNYYTLPVVDGFQWSNENQIAGLRFKIMKNGESSDLLGGDPIVSEDKPGHLSITWPSSHPAGTVIMDLNEDEIRIKTDGKALKDWFLELSWAEGKGLPIQDVTEQNIQYEYEGHPYSLAVSKGSIQNTNLQFLRIYPKKGSLIFTVNP